VCPLNTLQGVGAPRLSLLTRDISVLQRRLLSVLGGPLILHYVTLDPLFGLFIDILAQYFAKFGHFPKNNTRKGERTGPAQRR